LAEEIEKELDIPVINNILIRNKHTLPQVKLENSKQRKQNIKQAFSLEVRPRQLDFKNKTIILIDDISTTGATLKECTKALKPLKPKKIIGLVIARG